MKEPDLIEASQHILRIHDIKNIQSDVPAIHILSRSGCDLWIIGIKHTRDIQDPQIPILKAQFTDFKNQNYRNSILCLEGFVPTHLDDEKSSVEKYGEKAVLILMAQKYGIKITSIEPMQIEISEWALQLFPDPLAHAAWATLNVLTYSTEQLKTSLPKIASTYGFAENVEVFFKRISDYLRQEDILNLPNDLEQLAITPIDKIKTKEAQEPDDGPFPTNRAGSAINLARDYGLFRNTIKTLEENECNGAFAWFGLNHVVAMMPAFEKYGFELKNSNVLMIAV